MNKIVAPFVAIFYLLLITSGCGKKSEDNTPEITYPLLFAIQGLEFQPSHFYALNAGSFVEIPPAGSFVPVDAFLEPELEDAASFIELEKIELLDESQAKIYFFDNTGIPEITADYTSDNNRIRIVLEPGADPVFFDIDYEAGTARLGLESTYFSFHDSSGDVDYSPLDVEFKVPGSASDVISALKTQYDLAEGDTIMVNWSAVLYKTE